MIKRYVKKLVEIEAIQFNGYNWVECYQFMNKPLEYGKDYVIKDTTDIDGEICIQWIGVHESIDIETLEGTMKCSKGDYIIRGVNGEFYPCKPDIFEKTYEKVKLCKE